MEALSLIGEFFFDDGRATEEEQVEAYETYQKKKKQAEREANEAEDYPNHTNNDTTTNLSPRTRKAVAASRKKLKELSSAHSKSRNSSIKRRSKTTSKQQQLAEDSGGVSMTGSSTRSDSLSSGSTTSSGLASMIPETVCADLSIRSVSTRSNISESNETTTSSSSSTGSDDHLRNKKAKSKKTKGKKKNDHGSTESTGEEVDFDDDDDDDDDDLSYHSSSDDDSGSEEETDDEILTQEAPLDKRRRSRNPVKRLRSRARSGGFWGNPFRLHTRSVSNGSNLPPIHGDHHSSSADSQEEDEEDELLQVEDTLVVKAPNTMVDQLLKDMGIVHISASSSRSGNSSQSHSNTDTSAASSSSSTQSQSIGRNSRALVTQASAFEGGFETEISCVSSAAAVRGAGDIHAMKSNETHNMSIAGETSTVKPLNIHGWIETVDTKDGEGTILGGEDRIELELAISSSSDTSKNDGDINDVHAVDNEGELWNADQAPDASNTAVDKADANSPLSPGGSKSPAVALTKQNSLKTLFHKKLGITTSKPPLIPITQPSTTVALTRTNATPRQYVPPPHSPSMQSSRKSSITRSLSKKFRKTNSKVKEYALSALSSEYTEPSVPLAKSRIRSLPAGKSSGIVPMTPRTTTLSSPGTNVESRNATSHFTTKLGPSEDDGSIVNPKSMTSSTKKFQKFVAETTDAFAAVAAVAGADNDAEQEESYEQTLSMAKSSSSKYRISDSGIKQTRSITRRSSKGFHADGKPTLSDAEVAPLLVEEGSLETIPSNDGTLEEYVEVAYGGEDISDVDSINSSPITPTESLRGKLSRDFDHEECNVEDAVDSDDHDDVSSRLPRKRRSFSVARLLQRKMKGSGVSAPHDEPANNVLEDSIPVDTTENVATANSQSADVCGAPGKIMSPSSTQSKKIGKHEDESVTTEVATAAATTEEEKLAPVENGFVAAVQTLQDHQVERSLKKLPQEAENREEGEEILSLVESREETTTSLAKITRKSLKSLLPAKIRRNATPTSPTSPEQAVVQSTLSSPIKENTDTLSDAIDARDNSFQSRADDCDELRSFSTVSGTEVAFGNNNPWLETGHPNYEGDDSISTSDYENQTKMMVEKTPRGRSRIMLPVKKGVTFGEEIEVKHEEIKKAKKNLRKLKAGFKGILRLNIGKERSAQDTCAPVEVTNEGDVCAKNTLRQEEENAGRDKVDATFFMQHQLMQQTGHNDIESSPNSSSYPDSAQQRSQMQRVLGRRGLREGRKRTDVDSTTNSIVHPGIQSMGSSSSSTYSGDYTNNDETTLGDTTVGETTMQGYSVQNRRVLKTLRMLHAVKKRKQTESAMTAVSIQRNDKHLNNMYKYPVNQLSPITFLKFSPKITARELRLQQRHNGSYH